MAEGVPHLIEVSRLPVTSGRGTTPQRSAPPAAVWKTERFEQDPGWEGFRNRLVPDPAPITRQDFGYSPTHYAGGQRVGEIGGRIQRSAIPASYARVITPRGLDHKLSASGTFAVTHADGNTGLLFGWFNTDSRGWRTPNSLVFRIDGNDGKYWVFYEYGTRNWLTGGAGCFEGSRYQTTPTRPFAADGTPHRWSITYDPQANSGNGEILFVLDGTRYSLPLEQGHRADGARFNRFGILNQMITGEGQQEHLKVYFDDLVIDGKREEFTGNPHWDARGNRSEFADRIIRPLHDFGYANSFRAGGKPGEIGGIVWRNEEPAYYADRVGPFTLENELFASGKLAFTGAGSDSALYIGWFDSDSKRKKTIPQDQEPPRNVLAIEIEGPSRIGHYFRPAYFNRAAQGISQASGPVIRPDGKVHRWSLRYSPQANGGHGRITVIFDGETQHLDLKPEHRKTGATFNRFGLFNAQLGGHFVEVYLDDLKYTVRPTGNFTPLQIQSKKGARMPRLRVSENRRFLVKEDGSPFFYLGDTAWELFHRLNREEAERYLRDRAEKGFTVIQAVVLAELDGLHDPNPYGHTPLVDDDPTRPNEEYFRHVDWIVGKAEELGLTIGMLPTWGDKWNRGRHGTGPEVFNPENAGIYGEWLGRRYRDSAIIWILGGDRRVETEAHRAILEAMARGIRRGDGGTHLMTLHPPGGAGSSEWFHDADWLDFNMRQNGHVTEFTGRYENTRADYDRTPIKPVIDGEPIYEDHPVSFRANELGHSIAADVRRPLYWNLFTGACGHTYGHHSVWQMWQPGRPPINNPLMPWYEAIDQPGAGQMQFGRRLIESRPFLSRIPDDSVIVTDRVPTSVPGAGRYRFVATRDEAGTYAMVYAPVGRPFSVRMDAIVGPTVKAWWFNPRNGDATAIGEFPSSGTPEFVPPDRGELLDWVLVLDDAARGYPPPGQPART